MVSRQDHARHDYSLGGELTAENGFPVDYYYTYNYNYHYYYCCYYNYHHYYYYFYYYSYYYPRVDRTTASAPPPRTHASAPLNATHLVHSTLPMATPHRYLLLLPPPGSHLPMEPRTHRYRTLLTPLLSAVEPADVPPHGSLPSPPDSPLSTGCAG